MKITQILCLVAIVALSGCGSEGNVRPPRVDIRIFHAAPNFETLALLREENSEAQLAFSAGIGNQFDSGQYDFHVEYAPAGATSTVRGLNFSETLAPNFNYSFIAVSPGGQLDMLVAATPAGPASASTAQFSIIQANPNLTAVDVYVVAPGTLLSSAVKQGTVSYGPNPAIFEVTPLVYRLYLTPPGDPNTILFESVDQGAVAGGNEILVVSSAGGLGPRDVIVSSLSGGGATRISEAGLSSEIRVVQGIDDRLDRDIIFDGNTASPLFPVQSFGQISAYVPVTTDQHQLTLTPVATPGTIEATVSAATVSALSYLAVFAGDSVNGIFANVFREDKRPITGQATLRVVGAAGLFGVVDVFVLPPGSDINTSDPRARLSAPDISPRLAVIPGDYEITVQELDTATIVAGPEPVTLAADGVYGVLLLNSAGGSTVDLQYFYDFIP